MQRDDATVEENPPAARAVVADLARRRLARGSRANETLRCVHSGYLADGCSCRASVPLAVAVNAWAAVFEQGRSSADGFFHFAWHGEVWLAYGLRDGRVRGVYCPQHSTERDLRSAGVDSAPPPAAASARMGTPRVRYEISSASA